MTDESSSPRWHWEDPDEFYRKAAQVHADHGRCVRLESIAVAEPLFTRADLITVRAFRQGAVPVVAELDRPFRNDETIYVEATT